MLSMIIRSIALDTWSLLALARLVQVLQTVRVTES